MPIRELILISILATLGGQRTSALPFYIGNNNTGSQKMPPFVLRTTSASQRYAGVSKDTIIP